MKKRIYTPKKINIKPVKKDRIKMKTVSYREVEKCGNYKQTCTRNSMLYHSKPFTRDTRLFPSHKTSRTQVTRHKQLIWYI